MSSYKIVVLGLLLILPGSLSHTYKNTANTKTAIRIQEENQKNPCTYGYINRKDKICDPSHKTKNASKDHLFLFYCFNDFFKLKQTATGLGSFNKFIMLLKPFSLAMSTGCFPLLFFSFLFAPYSKSLLTTLVFPEITARCNGVNPPSSSYILGLHFQLVKQFVEFSQPK